MKNVPWAVLEGVDYGTHRDAAPDSTRVQHLHQLPTRPPQSVIPVATTQNCHAVRAHKGVEHMRHSPLSSLVLRRQPPALAGWRQGLGG